MKASLYVSYTTRSLFRGGQRTILAIFCIAVGVMSIVALQAVGDMINQALLGNVRDANGGDIAISSYVGGLSPDDLSLLDQLKSDGSLEKYTPVISATGSPSQALSVRDTFSLLAIDPKTYPVVTAPSLKDPANSNLTDLLTGNHIVIDQKVADTYHKQINSSFDIYVRVSGEGTVHLNTTVAGIVSNNGSLQNATDVVLISQEDYNAAVGTDIPVVYSSVYISTGNDKARTDKVVKALKADSRYSLNNIQTADDALKSFQASVDIIKKFLEIAGLLALLIGGVGIVNTMQVLRSRRRIEIAMLKTVGYRRFDLYSLFGLEAGLLGLIGGVIGALAAMGLSAIVLNVVERAFQLHVPYSINPVIIGGGVLIGLFTALIFGLMPIVQAANIRPLNVIREIPGDKRVAGIFLTLGLLLILSVLFCLMAIFILNDLWLGIEAVYGTFAFLALLSLFFALVILIIGFLPVPERFSFGYLALIIVALVFSALLALVLPAFGILMLILSLLGIAIVIMPRTWKVNIKMALRNIGRQRARTTTTMLALFVGVFTIGLILVLGQDLRDQLNNTFAKILTYNVLVTARGNDATTLHDKLNTVPGLSRSDQHTYATVKPGTIDGQPLGTLIVQGNTNSSPNNFSTLPPSVVTIYLSSIEGYDVTKELPDTQNTFTISEGRNLTAEDADTDNVLVPWQLVHLDPLKGHLNVGSTITLSSQDGKVTRTVTVVGVYQSKGFALNSGQIFASKNLAVGLTPAQQEISVFYMKVDTAKADDAVKQINKIAPSASVVSLANIGDYVDQVLGNVLLVLVVIASLSLLAGVIIIANAVALAMLERRRELGILKSVGYTSSSILSEVLIENGVVGGTGALLAMLLVTLVMSLLGRFVFKADFGVSWYIAIGLIVGIGLLASLVALFVAWGSVRVRPLEVLRYE